MAELMHMRGDNNALRVNMLQQIAFSGEVNFERTIDAIAEMPHGSTRGQAAHTLDIYYLGAGIKTDIIDSTYLTKTGSKTEKKIN